MPPACAAVSASWTPYDVLGSLFSKRSVIHRKSDSTVPFADGAYGGACSVIIPNRSTSTCRARSDVKIFPRSWKIMAGFPKRGQEGRHSLFLAWETFLAPL